MSLVLVTLKATYRSGATAEPKTGRLEITPLDRRVDAGDDIIYLADTVTVLPDETGTAVVQVATGNDVADPPYSYRIREVFEGVPDEPYEVVIPTAPAGSVVNLADLQPNGTWDSADVIPGGFGGF